MLFQNRTEAGRVLAQSLAAYADREDVVVLALPRGGVPVGYEVAQALDAPLDVFLVRKLGVPGREELALGAVASGGIYVLNEDVIEALGISRETISEIAGQQKRELEQRERAYRDDRPPPAVAGQVVILVDDGLATGSTMRAALAALRRQSPAKVIVAVPVGAPETCAEFQHEADETICVRTPDPFWSVGTWYRDFSQTTDREVHQLLARAAQRHREPLKSKPTPLHEL
jgi:putative phosphoribosyl transferase